MKVVLTVSTVIIALVAITGILLNLLGVAVALDCFYSESTYMSECGFMGSAALFANVLYVFVGVPALIVLWMACSTSARAQEHAGKVMMVAIILGMFQVSGGVFGAIVVGGGMAFPTLVVVLAALVYGVAVIGAFRPGRSSGIEGSATTAVEETEDVRDIFKTFGGWIAVWLIWLGFTVLFRFVVQSSTISDDTQDAFETAMYVGLSVLSAGMLIGLSVAMLRRRTNVLRPDARLSILVGLGLGFTSGMIFFGIA